ncbi:hypothetical protein [Gordonia sp. CNJ-863]|uniref:hypothetical protein n=1 Tax=Gordonia sp. CNJ-863 TaxID=1904963 RepID=UPI0021CB2B1A|nr:hypothetical protein [Gordonia sp. CNJ-863]
MPVASDPAERLVRVHWSVVAAMTSGSLSVGAHALAGGASRRRRTLSFWSPSVPDSVG